MKRIECECGRMVRLDRDDDSDRAICPYCGAKLAQLPDPTAPPASAEAEAKGPQVNKALLIGAAILIVLLAVGGVTAVVLLKKDRPKLDIASSTSITTEIPKPKADTLTQTSTPKAKDPLKGPYAIRLTAPRKKDDVREVELRGETLTRFTIVEGDTREPQPPKTTKVVLACKIRTLEVDDAGHELAWEFTVQQLEISRLDPVKALADTGDVLQAKLPKAAGQQVLDFSGAAAKLPEPVKVALTRAVGRRLGYWLTPPEDVMFGSAKPQMPGALWGASEYGLNQWFSGVSDVVWDRASGKLSQVGLKVAEGEKPFAIADMHVEGKAKIKDLTPSGSAPIGPATAELEAKVQYRFRLTDEQGPYTVTSQVNVVTKDEGKSGVGSEELLREEYTLNIRFLPLP
jgi:hypothetical protein